MPKRNYETRKYMTLDVGSYLIHQNGVVSERYEGLRRDSLPYLTVANCVFDNAVLRFAHCDGADQWMFICCARQHVQSAPGVHVQQRISRLRDLMKSPSMLGDQR
jgi:hypothetical protein